MDTLADHRPHQRKPDGPGLESASRTRMSPRKHGNLLSRASKTVLKRSALRSNLGRSGTSLTVLGNVKSYCGDSETVGPPAEISKTTFPWTFGDVPDCPKVKCVALDFRTVWGLRISKIVSYCGNPLALKAGAFGDVPDCPR